MTPEADSSTSRPARLRVSEIFHSIQGESHTTGERTVFVRLTGCPLRCSWCDTAYAFSGGELRSLDSIMDAVAAFGSRHVCVTGGEPLAQADCRALLGRLCDAGYLVQLETSGALDITGAQVAWAARCEMARAVEDVLARRTRALFLDARAALAAAPAVAGLLAAELRRGPAWTERQLREFQSLAARYLA